ncbi:MULTISPECIES: endonuclease/exonuclease/phosphatase family protein [unclassified Microbacterium]|uniref:endonuclease/exonuclease/phosphatase family protein n=1 Tax=unclassified Microbacterium TaxID=2609290 RepID=UPI00109C21E9|nr:MULTISPECIES: endonuclease/exonuclease/phosphatase family protein [unclassified Microbacterium]
MIDVAHRAPLARRTTTRRARRLAIAGIIVLVLVACGWIPGVIGTAVAAVLPWLGLVILALVVTAFFLARRVIVLLLVPALLWILAMVPALPALPAPADAEEELTIASQNVRAHSGSAAASATELARSEADVIALTELDGDSLSAASEVLADAYPHSYTVGTVALWSRYPLTSAEPLTLGLSWKRALRVEVQSPAGPVAVYVLHAASVRPGQQQDRDTMLHGIAEQVASDEATALVVVGDFNAPSTDPALAALRAEADWARPTDGTLGFTWPAAFPLVRIDQVFVRGVDVVTSGTLRTGNSDHLATMTRVR